MKTKYFMIVAIGFLAMFCVSEPVSAQTADATSMLISAPARVDVDDTFYGWQWYLEAIYAPEAWAMATSGPREVVVAVIDGGMDDTHPDLKGVLWTDPDEPVDGIDNDGDGLIDDAHGWNFTNQTSSTRPVSRFYVAPGAWEHGTMVSSLIGARGNDSIGMAGVAWNVKIMPLVILDADGVGDTDILVKAIEYAVRHRADIINMSLEGTISDPAVGEAIERASAQGVLVVIAAGNGHDGLGIDLDEEPLFPACHTGAALQSVLVVGATDEWGERYESSNFGSCVHLSAPGVEILAGKPTYDPDGNRTEVSGYGTWTGTSLSAPLVTGVAALLKAQHPAWTGEQLAQRILDTVQPFVEGVDAHGMGRGMLDASAAMSPADPLTYGAWDLLVSEPGQVPMAWIVDEQGNELFSIPIGNPGDHRAFHAAFVRWDEDRLPEIIVTTEDDPAGNWRVYQRDGILIAAGQVTKDGDRVSGGLLVSTQDLYGLAQDMIALTESKGHRLWLLTPSDGISDPIEVVETPDPLGVLPVGIERPVQAFVFLGRDKFKSRLSVLTQESFDDGMFLETERPERLQMVHGRTLDNRELLQIVQSGPPSYLMEHHGMIDKIDQAEMWQLRQAPLGYKITGIEGRLFYDTWPR